MKIFKTKKYSILSNILKFSFVGIFAIVLIFPSLFINNSVKNTEAVYTGIYALNTTATQVELKAHGLLVGADYQANLGKGDVTAGTFKSDVSIDILATDVGSDGIYIFKMNHPTGYTPGTIYTVTLDKISPPSFLNVAYSSVAIPNTTSVGPGTTTGTTGPGTTTGNNDEETGLTINTKINNPLGDKITDIPSFIEALVNIVLIVGIPIVALAIIYTGFLFVTAQGNSEKITKAKKALVYTLIGAALLLGAFVIAQAIGATVDDIKSTT